MLTGPIIRVRFKTSQLARAGLDCEPIAQIPMTATFTDHRRFHVVKTLHEPTHITNVYATIVGGRQRAAGEDVNVRAVTTDKNDPFSGLDTRVHFRGEDIADKGVAQRDQMDIGR